MTESYSRVSLGDEDVELNMRTIPENEPYGARVRMWYRWYCQEYASITRDLQAFGRPRGPQWFAWRMLKRVSRLKKRTVMLESLGGDDLQHSIHPQHVIDLGRRHGRTSKGRCRRTCRR